ncbi:hypothetical protein LOTGIDRAFT_235727 [Lottia gigantea]|uniref:Uncharacterized protein n=1 Tax=Lottia gigantea TaxID=225164 RepID=V3ZXQ2_LOTGI|nr:hypothetical protein LOTGIDRAFT_235727 [Lottia gigantea]ESO85761.1 hypothetical protein LOTGIDRAFT_235727 [Lottia gigantea]
MGSLKIDFAVGYNATKMVLSSFNFVASILFTLECYHIIGHLAILLRIRMLPRRDLVRIRLYFLVDALTVFITNFIYIGKLKWLATLQIIQHLFYFFTWDQSYLAKKIIDWSSLDWFSSYKNGRVELDSILGTAFDVGVHAINAYILSQYMSMLEIFIGVSISYMSIGYFLFSSKYAWSSPYSMPKWVQQRIRPIVPL